MKAEHLMEAAQIVKAIEQHKSNIEDYKKAGEFIAVVFGKYLTYTVHDKGYAEMKLALIAIEEQSIAQLTKRADQIGLHI